MVWSEKRPLTMEEWVDVATRGLCAGAQNRIAEDIYEHLAEALEEGLGRGLSYEEVKRDAVVSLGDPKAANREFRKTHLTKQEARLYAYLCREEQIPLRPLMLALGIPPFVGIAVIGLILASVKAGFSGFLMGLAVVGFVGLAGHVADRCVRAASDAFRRRLGSGAKIPFVLLSLPFCIPQGIDVLGPVVGTILTLTASATFVCLFAAPMIGLWRKAGRSRVALDDHDLGGPGMT